MRWIAPAIGPVLTLVAVSVPANPAHSAVPHATQTRAERTSSRAITTLKSSGPLGVDHVRVSWEWVKSVTGYRIQVSKNQGFSAIVTTQKKKNSARRPAGGREAATVGHLRDASYYWVRVRKVNGSHASSWSSPVRVATRAHMPDRITRTLGRRGRQPGSATIRWKSRGGHTDFYRITTALTPFGSSDHPGKGRHPMTWRAPGGATHYTLSPAQTAQAGAALGTARHLFFRIKAVRAGKADTAVRSYNHLNSTTVAGRGSSGNGTKLRFAAYNVHVASKDVKGHPWSKRQHLIAKKIAKFHPAVVGISELMPNMWTSDAGGKGLHRALRRAGAGRYKLTRTTSYWKDAGQDARILYDPNKVTLASGCDDSVPSCYIMVPDSKKHIAAYALFHDRASGREFYFVTAHLSPGNNAKTDALRGRQAQAMSSGIKGINESNVPVIFATDANSSQTSAGVDAPHSVLLADGWYNTQAAATVVNDKVNSVNHYAREGRSPYGFGSMYDSIMTLNLPGAALWKQVLTGSPWPSDHNMVFADLRLP